MENIFEIYLIKYLAIFESKFLNTMTSNNRISFDLAIIVMMGGNWLFYLCAERTKTHVNNVPYEDSLWT